MKMKKKGRGGDDVPIFTDLLLSFFSRGKATWRDQFVARVSVTQGPCVSRSTLDDLGQTDDRWLLLLAFRFPHSTVAYPVIGRGKYPSHASHSLLQQVSILSATKSREYERIDALSRFAVSTLRVRRLVSTWFSSRLFRCKENSDVGIQEGSSGMVLQIGSIFQGINALGIPRD